jgi:hypothetical protein
MVTKSQIDKLREPSLKLVDHVTIEMLGMVGMVALKVSTMRTTMGAASNLGPLSQYAGRGDSKSEI